MSPSQHGEGGRRVMMDQMFKIIFRGFRGFLRQLYLTFNKNVSFGNSNQKLFDAFLDQLGLLNFIQDQ